MKKKLLELPANKWYDLTKHPKRDELIKILNELIAERSRFEFSEDKKMFRRLPSSLFDLVGQPGYRTVETKLDWGRVSVELFYEDKWIATK